MFDIGTSYTYCRVGDHSSLTVNRKFVEHLSIYRFKTNNYTYLVEVERYPHHIYVLKFYQRKYKGSKEKFNLLTHEGRCSRIVGTCFSIFMDIYNKNPLASFGFIGAHTIDKKTGATEQKNNTKRYRIYSLAVMSYFGEETFTHLADPSNSVYLAISNKNQSVMKIADEANKILAHLL